MEKASLEARVYGFVQGVGYRFYVIQRARELNVTGYVKNLKDGSVLVHAEGDKETLDKVLQLLKKGPSGARVNDVEIEWGEGRGNYNSFDVRY